jgi:saccharopine dehydrogenase-like NADP-dependent oxidoreductase
MENLRWLGLLSDERIGCEGDTAAAMLIHMLQTKLPLTPEMRDMVLLVHELDVEFPDDDRPAERIRSTLVLEGEDGGFTAMARSVGLPVVIAVKLLLDGELSLTGSLIPTHPSIYAPILRLVERAGLRFKESRTQIADA